MGKIIVPPSAKPNPEFGNKKTMLVGGMAMHLFNVVFDEEFNVIIVVPEDQTQFVQFDNNVALDRYLDQFEARVRYHTVSLPMHGDDIPDDWFYENGITIESKVEAPWNVEFSGSRYALTCMIAEFWHEPKLDWLEFERTVACIQGATPDYNEVY